MANFNPLRREGGDNHSPGPQPTVFPYFNPLRREGGDDCGKTSIDKTSLFQSTPPRGRRQSGHNSPFFIAYFNPLRREGGDVCEGPEGRDHHYFNPLRREGGDDTDIQAAR